MRALVAWWYSPILGKWQRWSRERGDWPSGAAFERAARIADYMPDGRSFVDQWRRTSKGWQHETRYRFGAVEGARRLR